jgi:hypothetical protein
VRTPGTDRRSRLIEGNCAQRSTAPPAGQAVSDAQDGCPLSIYAWQLSISAVRTSRRSGRISCGHVSGNNRAGWPTRTAQPHLSQRGRAVRKQYLHRQHRAIARGLKVKASNAWGRWASLDVHPSPDGHARPWTHLGYRWTASVVSVTRDCGTGLERLSRGSS